MSDKINVYLRGPDNIVSRYFIKKIAPFHKLIHAYCERMNQPMQTVRFCLSDNNTAINGSDTGTSLNLKDCAEIMVFHDESTPHRNQAKSGSTLDLSLMNLSMNALRFRLDGNTFNETDTAASLDMQDGAEIEVFHDGKQQSPLELSRTSNELSKMQKILVRQRGPENTVSQYIIKRDTPLRRLIHAYCERMTVRFCLSNTNTTINGSDTASSLNLRDCATMKVFHDESTPHRTQVANGYLPDLSQISISGRPKSSIHVKVIEPNYIETQFKINMNMPLRKLMHAFCDLTSQSMNAVQFLLDGQQLAENDTAASLELKEGAMIEVWLSSWADF